MPNQPERTELTARLPWSGAPSPLLLGHRGTPRVATENSRAALAGAVTAGLDGFETDLQRASDGALLLNHDPELRTGEVIADLDGADARRLAPELIGLPELLELMQAHEGATVNLEVKTSAPRSDARAAELAQQLRTWPADVLARLWLSTFDPLLLLRLHEEAVPVPQAFLVVQASALALLPVLPVAAVHPHHALVTRQRVSDWHAAGLGVFTWTVNEPDLARRLLGLGVDGLIGDEPRVLLEAAGRQ